MVAILDTNVSNDNCYYSSFYSDTPYKDYSKSDYEQGASGLLKYATEKTGRYVIFTYNSRELFINALENGNIIVSVHTNNHTKNKQELPLDKAKEVILEILENFAYATSYEIAFYTKGKSSKVDTKYLLSVFTREQAIAEFEKFNFSDYDKNILHVELREKTIAEREYSYLLKSKTRPRTVEELEEIISEVEGILFESVYYYFNYYDEEERTLELFIIDDGMSDFRYVKLEELANRDDVVFYTTCIV